MINKVRADWDKDVAYITQDIKACCNCGNAYASVSEEDFAGYICNLMWQEKLYDYWVYTLGYCKHWKPE